MNFEEKAKNGLSLLAMNLFGDSFGIESDLTQFLLGIEQSQGAPKIQLIGPGVFQSWDLNNAGHRDGAVFQAISLMSHLASTSTYKGRKPEMLISLAELFNGKVEDFSSDSLPFMYDNFLECTRSCSGVDSGVTAVLEHIDQEMAEAKDFPISLHVYTSSEYDDEGGYMDCISASSSVDETTGLTQEELEVAKECAEALTEIVYDLFDAEDILNLDGNGIEVDLLAYRQFMKLCPTHAMRTANLRAFFAGKLTSMLESINDTTTVEPESGDNGSGDLEALLDLVNN